MEGPWQLYFWVPSSYTSTPHFVDSIPSHVPEITDGTRGSGRYFALPGSLGFNRPEYPEEYLRLESVIVNLTLDIMHEPRCPSAWFQRANALHDLGYVELALGDLWKVKMLFAEGVDIEQHDQGILQDVKEKLKSYIDFTISPELVPPNPYPWLSPTEIYGDLTMVWRLNAIIEARGYPVRIRTRMPTAQHHDPLHPPLVFHGIFATRTIAPAEVVMVDRVIATGTTEKHDACFHCGAQLTKLMATTVGAVNDARAWAKLPSTTQSIKQRQASDVNFTSITEIAQSIAPKELSVQFKRGWSGVPLACCGRRFCCTACETNSEPLHRILCKLEAEKTIIDEVAKFLPPGDQQPSAETSSGEEQTTSETNSPSYSPHTRAHARALLTLLLKTVLLLSDNGSRDILQHPLVSGLATGWIENLRPSTVAGDQPQVQSPDNFESVRQLNAYNIVVSILQELRKRKVAGIDVFDMFTRPTLDFWVLRVLGAKLLRNCYKMCLKNPYLKKKKKNEDGHEWAYCLTEFSPWLNHGCRSNVMKLHGREGENLFVSCREINEGEEITANYLSLEDNFVTEGLEEREAKLKEVRVMSCQCITCRYERKKRREAAATASRD